MKKIATLFSLLFVAILASAQPKQTYLSDFKKGQTATYECFFTKSFQRNSDGTMVEGVGLYSSRSGVYMTEMIQLITSGDTISNKFSLKVLEATPYAYIMEMKIIDIGLPKSIMKGDDAKELLEIINIIRSMKFRLIFSKQMNDWNFANTAELYKSFITEARKNKNSFIAKEKKISDEELIAEMQEMSAINFFTQIFMPGIKAFSDAYRLRYHNGHHEEGELKEKEESFHYVSDVQKGKRKEFSFKYYFTSLCKQYDAYQNLEEAENDTIVANSEDSLSSYDTDMKLCKEQNLVEMKANKDSWLELYENKTIINYPSGIGTICGIIRRCNN